MDGTDNDTASVFHNRHDRTVIVDATTTTTNIVLVHATLVFGGIQVIRGTAFGTLTRSSRHA